MPTPSAPRREDIDAEDLELPAQCEGLTDSELDKAKSLRAKTGNSFEQCCLDIRAKRPRSAGRRKTRRARKNKKRQQKKSRRNYK
jgi:hypothetical protein